MAEKINITPTEKVQELVIRNGDAQKYEQPLGFNITSTIFGPADFCMNRSPDPATTYVVYSYSDRRITLTTRENLEEKYRQIVDGQVKLDPNFTPFRINGNPWQSPSDLGNFFRRNRMFFESLEANAGLVTALKRFNSSVLAKTEKVNDLSEGKYKQAVEKTVESNIGANASFVLNMPIFQGLGNTRFTVDIHVDVVNDGTGVRFYLESIELREFMHDTVKKSIDEQLKKLRENGNMPIFEKV